ncbi:MAG: sugar-binding transcriptional regulator, partial [Mesorhizobium sp.]
MKNFAATDKNIKRAEMVGFGNGLLRDDETSMAARAAWLHYA